MTSFQDAYENHKRKQMEKLEKKLFDQIDGSMLKALPNPAKNHYEQKIKIGECTFLGVHNQPDYAKLYVTIYAKEKIVELKSLKLYIGSLRDIIVSYERFLDIFYSQMMEAYDPLRLRIVMQCNPRGGISSKLTIDSDWSANGGKEEYKDWHSSQDTWSVEM